MRLYSFACFIAASTASFCAGCGRPAAVETDATLQSVRLPDNFPVQAEVEVTPADMQRGMMYRDSLAPGRGMLFIHSSAGMYPYWMANCKIPLDIIWMDADHRVIEISANTPPCPSGGRDCPTYGGHQRALFVLELGSGEAARHHVTEGSNIQF